MHLIAPHGGAVVTAGTSVPADATVFNADSVVYDGLVVADGVDALDPKSVTMVQDAYRHGKTVAGWGTGVDRLAEAAIPAEGPGVVTGSRATKSFTGALTGALAWHRHWDR